MGPGACQKSSSAQYNWAMAPLQGLKLDGDEKILDIGCGDGRITAHLAGLVPGGQCPGNRSLPGNDPLCSRQVCRSSRLKVAIPPNLREFDLVVSFCLPALGKRSFVRMKAVRQSLVPGGHFLMQCGGRGNAARILDLTADACRQPVVEGCFFRLFLSLPLLRSGRVQGLAGRNRDCGP